MPQRNTGSFFRHLVSSANYPHETCFNNRWGKFATTHCYSKNLQLDSIP